MKVGRPPTLHALAITPTTIGGTSASEAFWPIQPVCTDRVGGLLVSALACGMVLAPGIAWMFGGNATLPAVLARGAVAAVAVLLVWSPLPISSEWRRMLAVSLLAAHHLGVGAALELPMDLFVELLVGAVYVGGLGCWLLPHSGFGAVTGVTLAMGTVALGMLAPTRDPLAIATWGGVFLLGGLAAELSLWVGRTVLPPGRPVAEAPEPRTERTSRARCCAWPKRSDLAVVQGEPAVPEERESLPRRDDG